MDWNAEYSVGIHELDEQHKKLLACVSAIEQSVNQGQRWAMVHSELVRLSSFAELHFAVEEALMRIHDYPRLEEHVNEHRGFADRLRALQERSLKTEVSRDMVQFLRNWVEQHIPGHDRPCVFHFLRRSALSTHQA